MLHNDVSQLAVECGRCTPVGVPEHQVPNGRSSGPEGGQLWCCIWRLHRISSASPPYKHPGLSLLPLATPMGVLKSQIDGVPIYCREGSYL